MELFLLLVLLGAGAVACLSFLLSRLRSNVLASLANSESLRLQLSTTIASLSTRAKTAEEQHQSLLETHNTLVSTLNRMELASDEIKYLRDANAHLQNALYESASTAQRRILELASPLAAEGERRTIPGYKPSFADGFRALPPDDSPVDTVRYPNFPVPTVRPAQSEQPTTAEAAGYRAEQPTPPVPPPPGSFAEEEDVDSVFRQ